MRAGASLPGGKAERAGPDYPGGEKPQRDPTDTDKHPKGRWCQGHGARLLSEVPSDRTGAHGHNLNTRKHSCSLRQPRALHRRNPPGATGWEWKSSRDEAQHHSPVPSDSLHNLQVQRTTNTPLHPAPEMLSFDIKE